MSDHRSYCAAEQRMIDQEASEPAPRPETVEVPVEPTQEMIVAGGQALAPWVSPAMHSDECYRAMLAARPTTAEMGVENVEREAKVSEILDAFTSLRAQLNAAQNIANMLRKSRDRLSAELVAADVEIASLRAQVAELTAERDAWKTACRRSGVCMTCVLGATDPFGCTDCLNTGWGGGAPVGFVSEQAANATIAQQAKRIEELEAVNQSRIGVMIAEARAGDIPYSVSYIDRQGRHQHIRKFDQEDEKLKARIEELEAALRPFAEEADYMGEFALKAQRRARALLSSPQTEADAKGGEHG